MNKERKRGEAGRQADLGPIVLTRVLSHAAVSSSSSSFSSSSVFPFLGCLSSHRNDLLQFTESGNEKVGEENSGRERKEKGREGIEREREREREKEEKRIISSSSHPSSLRCPES